MKLFASRLWFAGNFVAAMMGVLGAGPARADQTLPYLNPSLPVGARMHDLLGRMTLDEKIGQMAQADLLALRSPSDVQTYCLGSVLSGGDSKPRVNSPEGWLKTVDALQSWALKTRLKVPILYGFDAVHGANDVIGTVIFPHNIGLGATHNPALVLEAEHVTAEEMAGLGIRWTFAPCVAVAQDERWGRTYESFGQSPDWVAEMATMAVKGFQGYALSTNADSVLACAKHFIGDGGTLGGVDQGDTVCSEATLRKLYLPPYRAAVAAGVGSIMVSYSSWNGKKMSGNKYLLTDVLKRELGFNGFLVSDWAAIDQLSPDYKADVEQAINAGLDMIMIPYGPGHTNNYAEFIQDLKQLVQDKKVPLSRINDAVSRILRIKFQMGLFEHPYTGSAALLAAIGSPEHRQVARECVRASLVLLKNARGALPLSKKIKRLVVTGRGADDLGMQCGGWTIAWQGSGQLTRGTTILQAIRQTVSPRTRVVFSPDGDDIGTADAVVVVVGERPYAETVGDRTNLDLSPQDVALVERARASGAPVVTIVLSGRPLVLGPALDASDALLAAWLPGTEGEGVADVLFGDYAPTGKLPREWPRNNRQLAANALNGRPLFPVGFGLAY